MANFENLKNGKVRASICINGHRKSKILAAGKAKSWARETETEFSKLTKIEDDTRTFEDLVKRYSREISPIKGSCRSEQNRLARFETTSGKANSVDHKLSKIKLKKLRRQDFEEWINKRLLTVKSSTVNRELNILSNCITYAKRWEWMVHNPMQDLLRPKDPKPRNRRVSDEEIEMICQSAGFNECNPLTNKQHFVAVAFLFAIETAMRMGEICSLEPGSINFETRVAHLDKTKNGDEREVPLSLRAIELLKILPDEPNKNGHIFHQTPSQMDANFRKIKRKTPIEDLHFHDTRHEATTRLAKLPGMGVLRLAKITGHRDIKCLMIYFNESAAEMVTLLDSKAVYPAAIPGEISDQLVQELLKRMAAQFMPQPIA